MDYISYSSQNKLCIVDQPMILSEKHCSQASWRHMNFKMGTLTRIYRDHKF